MRAENPYTVSKDILIYPQVAPARIFSGQDRNAVSGVLPWPIAISLFIDQIRCDLFS